MDWRRVLAYITGTADQELLLRNEYLATENRILRGQLKGRLRLTDPERKTLAQIAQRLGRKALQEVAQIVTPDTILRWYRKLVAGKFDGSNEIPFPLPADRIGKLDGSVLCRERLGGLLKFYSRRTG